MPLSRLTLLLSLLTATQPRPTSPERAKAEAMLRDRLPCLGCHALGAGGGRLAPDLVTVRARRTPSYVAAMIDDPQRTVPGTIMPRVPLPAATRELLVRYLTGAAEVPAPASVGAPSGGDTSGARLYGRYCAGCHGATGGGDGPNARFLPVRPAVHASADEMGRRTDDRLYDAIAAGGESLGRSPRMPPFGATLAPAQIEALVRHIRALCRCTQPAWAADGARR